MQSRHPRAAAFLVAILFASSALAQAPTTDPLAPMTASIARAERALSEGETQVAESRYRDALYAGWMVLGAVATADGRFTDARDAFSRASASVVDSADAQQSLAMVDLRLNDSAAALPVLTKLVAANPKNTPLQRLLAQALIAAKQPAEAVQILVEAHGAAPDDPETTFALATGYLRVKKPEAARPLFDALAAARPLPETYVLIGRAYRDASMYPEARTALEKALAMNPRVKHAHYYLGTAAVMEEGVVRVDEAIADFRHELENSPGDPATTLLLGMAYVEAHKDKDALPLLEAAAAAPNASWRAFQYLGRCELALARPKEAAEALRKAIALSADVPTESRIGNLHYQLAQALRQAGDSAGADAEFTRAAALAASLANAREESLQRYLTDTGDAPGSETPEFALDSGPIAKLEPKTRDGLRTRASTNMARIYLNLGILQARGERFARAAELMQAGAALDATLPNLQYSLGVASFNARQYGAAAAALEKAIAVDAGNADAKRMLALASINTKNFPRAAELLAGDPELHRNPSLEYAYGVALVHSGHAAEAEQLFSSLLQAHADNAQLNVLLGEAHAEQGDYDGAIAALQHALALQPDVADANRALGFIYMKQGRLAEAEAALRAELASHGSDLAARYTLATVLDMDGKQADATQELSRVLQQQPDDPDARYLMGKILLARGSAADAVDHLEIAARLAPQDANVHYQLALAYQKLGRTEDAQKEFVRFQELKADRRGGSR